MIAYAEYESDTRVQAYAQSLLHHGYDVDVVALGHAKEQPGDDASGIRIFRILARERNERSKISYLARLSLFFFRSMFVVTREHIKNRYDLIHVHSVPDFEVFAVFVPKLMGTKIILDIHDLVPELYASKFNISPQSSTFKLLLAVEWMSAIFSDHVIAANDIWLERLRNRSVSDEKCTALLTFPSEETFHSRPRRRMDNKFVIVYPGTLNYHQGVDIAIRAFSLIQEKAPHAEFHIYGSGPQLESLRSLVAVLNVKDKVFLHSMLPTKEISVIMANADLGIVPKRKNSFGNEAFSSKILEFMCLGIPVIIPDTAIDRYYFNDSVAKFFKANDDKSLADAILLLIETPELRQMLARNAAEFVRKYTWEANQSTYLSLVEALLKPV